jgi:hypothetical protein
MHKPLPTLLAAGLLAAMPAFAGELSVEFVAPEKYTDAGYSRSFASEKDRAQVQRDVQAHLQRLAQRHLAEGESLRIEVLDIDLAGHFEPWRSASAGDVRIVRDVTWPRMQLRYALTRGGQVVAQGEERVSDMNFLVGGNRYSDSDRLRYEKAMLDGWFERRFGNGRG